MDFGIDLTLTTRNIFGLTPGERFDAQTVLNGSNFTMTTTAGDIDILATIACSATMKACPSTRRSGLPLNGEAQAGTGLAMRAARPTKSTMSAAIMHSMPDVMKATS